ncbi:MAG: thymidine kinase [Clostridia bacterium]|nr:thymidine kinase [Clostridia bacterium]
MNKLHFKYGAMGSSKTAQALMTRYGYEEKGAKTWLIKPATDSRDGVSVLRSRIGLEAEATVIAPDVDIREMLEVLILDGENIEVIIADESQFFTEKQVWELREIVSRYDLTVICYGLRTDFRCRLFPGSKALLELADDIDEIASACKCGHKAFVNARFDENGRVTVEGPQVALGSDDRYESMCWTCWREALRENGYTGDINQIY